MTRNWLPLFARVRSALMRQGRTAQEAEDLVQEAWVRLACFERDRAPVDDPEPYLMRTALNLSIDAYRARARHGDEVALDELVVVDTAPGIEAVVLGRERMERLNVCMHRLSERSRDIFMAYRVEGLTYAEIGKQQGLSISAVEQYVARATLQLMNWMEGW